MKETLQRLLMFFSSKTSNLEVPEVKSMSFFLTKISQQKNSKKGIKEEQSESESSAEDDEQNEMKENRNSRNSLHL